MDCEISVELTPRIVRWAVFYQLRGALFILAMMLLALSWDSIIRMRVGVRWIWGAYATPGIFILFIGWIVYYSYRHSLAQVRKMKTPVIHYRVTDEFLYVQSDLASGQNSWAIFKGLQKHAKLWRIITQQGASMILPVENLDDALKSFLSAKLSSVDKPFGSRFFVILGFWFLVFIVIMYFFKSKHH